MGEKQYSTTELYHEWCKAEPEGQDELWEEILSQLHPYFLKEDYQGFKEQFKQSYLLIKK